MVAGAPRAWAQAGGMQVPGGMSVPGVPGGFSKNGFLQQASMKSSGKLPPAQAKKAESTPTAYLSSRAASPISRSRSAP